MSSDSRRVSSHEAICPSKRGKSELVILREQTANKPEYWRSLQELAGDPEFQERLHREFPKGASEWLQPLSRRDFLSLMAASLALAGMAGCVKQPAEQIVPYVVQPENIVPGKAKFYATAMTLSGYGIPSLVESHMARPTKIEGNPQHPASLGASDIFSQASVLDLYDPDRSQSVTFKGQPQSWFAFLSKIRPAVLSQPDIRVRFLTQSVSSPTLAGLAGSHHTGRAVGTWGASTRCTG